MSSVLRVYLSAKDRQRPLELTRSGHASARLISRAHILLLVDRNQPSWQKHREVVIALKTSLARISRVSRRYVLEGLDAALSEEPRAGTPPKMTGEIEAQLILRSDPPEGRKRWTLRLLAEQMVLLGHIPSLSNVTVYQRLKKCGQALAGKIVVHPGGQREVLAKMEDVLDVYQRPINAKRPVVCVDEMTKELTSTPYGSTPMSPDQPQGEDYKYERHGTINVFMSVEPLAGKRRVRVTERHTRSEFADIAALPGRGRLPRG